MSGEAVIVPNGIRYFHVSVASTALTFVGPQVWPELSLDRLRADGLIAKNISLRDSEDELEMLLGYYFIFFGSLTQNPGFVNIVGKWFLRIHVLAQLHSSQRCYRVGIVGR